MYIGCYNDNSTNRDLDATGSERININSGGSVGWCVSYCIELGKSNGLENGYDYAGMQNK
jgi:hypothetical protein